MTPEIHKASSTHFVVRYPGTLRVEKVAGFDGLELVLAVEDAEPAFSPNMVFTSVKSEAPLVDAAVTAYLAAELQHPGACLVSVDAFFDAEAENDTTPIGRVITFAYPATGSLEVMVKKWIVATGTHHLHFTASCLPSQVLKIMGTFDWIASHVEFTASRDQIMVAAQQTTVSGVRLDEQASIRAGFPVEDLSVVPESLPRAARSVPASAAQALADTWGVHLGQPPALHVIVTRGEEQAFYVAYSAQDGVLVIRSSGDTAFDFAPAEVQGYGLGPEHLPANVAAWLRIKPEFRFGSGTTVAPREYANRIGAEHGEKAWTDVRVGSAGHWIRAAYIPGEGYSEGIARTEDLIELRPLPAGRFFDLILRRIDSALGTRDSQMNERSR